MLRIGKQSGKTIRTNVRRQHKRELDQKGMSLHIGSKSLVKKDHLQILGKTELCNGSSFIVNEVNTEQGTIKILDEQS